MSQIKEPKKQLTYDELREIVLRPIPIMNNNIIPGKTHGSYCKPVQADHRNSEMSIFNR